MQQQLTLSTPAADPSPGPVSAPEPAPGFWDDAEVISRYTAAQGVEDGVLVDALQIEPFREHFAPNPVYLTAALWALIEKAIAHPTWCNDLAGVCHDIIWMGRGAVTRAARQAQAQGSGRSTFLVIITGTGRVRNHHLDAVLDGEGLTFCLAGED